MGWKSLILRRAGHLDGSVSAGQEPDGATVGKSPRRREGRDEPLDEGFQPPGAQE